MQVLIAILIFFLVAGTFSSSFYGQHFLQSHLNPQTLVEVPTTKWVEYNWPSVCTGRVMRKFDRALNYEHLNAIGAKWVFCLGKQGATGGLSTPLPCPPYRPAAHVKTEFEKQLLPMAHSPVHHSVCPCSIGYLPYQPFSFIAVFVPKLPGYNVLHLLIKIKFYFKSIWKLVALFGPQNLHRWANKQP